METETLNALEEVSKLEDELNSAILLLNESCITFIREYDIFLDSEKMDAAVLKQKMKDALIRAVPDDV